MLVTFQKYHLEHHKCQGVQGMDMDIPVIQKVTCSMTNVLTKMAWVLCQLFFYALRPVFLNPKQPRFGEVLNLIFQLTYDGLLLYYSGRKALVYLLLSTFVGGGMHPMAGHFIAEHYVFLKGQETYSYYGPLNLLTWNVGYHLEHHDFPRIPGVVPGKNIGCNFAPNHWKKPTGKLHKVRQIAPQFYEDFTWGTTHGGRSYVIYKPSY